MRRHVVDLTLSLTRFMARAIALYSLTCDQKGNLFLLLSLSLSYSPPLSIFFSSSASFDSPFVCLVNVFSLSLSLILNFENNETSSL